MTDMDRRSALALGSAAALPSLAAATPAAAGTYSVETYGPNAGEEVVPGVREVFLAKADVALSTYKIVWMTDLVFRPGAGTPADVAANDAVCMMVEGLLRVRLGEEEFVAKKGSLWATPKGTTERRSNSGAGVAVVRVIDLLPGL